MTYHIFTGTNGMCIGVIIADDANINDVFTFLNDKYQTTFRLVGHVFFDRTETFTIERFTRAVPANPVILKPRTKR